MVKSLTERDFSRQGRTPDPQRMLRAYHHAAATMNLLRAMNQPTFPDYPEKLFSPAPTGVVEIGSTDHDFHLLQQKLYSSYHLHVREDYAHRPLFTSHEALLLHYEEAMTRKDTQDGAWYNCSAHMLWLESALAILTVRILNTCVGSPILSASNVGQT